MKIKALKTSKDYSRGLTRHCLSAHNGIIKEDCQACLELQEKVKKPPEKKKGGINIPSIVFFYQRGKTPTANCTHGWHLKCSGRHGKKYGLPGVKCSCECHIHARTRDINIGARRVT